MAASQETESRVIHGRYELLRPIGTGGVARVYLALDRLLHRQVAVKVLLREAAADPAFAERFRREAKAIASLNHPNIVTVYDWGSSDDTDYLVMEYVAGGNLAEHLRARGRLDEVEALGIAAGIVSGLQAAHEHGIVHRDVKPHNVLLDAHGHPKVADFGIARAAGLTELTQTNNFVGTASYISPEQAQGHRVDGRSDLYSLGVVLYLMLTGRLPFRGETMIDVALKHIQERPVPPRTILPAISSATNALVLQALAKSPDARFQNAQEMLEALEQVRNNLHSERVPFVASAAEPARTQPAPIMRPARVNKRTPPPERSRPVRADLPDISERKRPARADLRPDPATRQHAPARQRHVSPALLAALPVVLALLTVATVMAAHPWSSSGRHRTAASPPATARSRHAAPAHKSATHSVPVRPSAGSSAGRSRRHTSTSSRKTAPPASSSGQGAAPIVPSNPVAVAQPEPPSSSQAPAHGSSATSASGPVAVAVASPPGNAADSVIQFYTLVSAHQFTNAANLWSPALQLRDPPGEYIAHRFSATQSITVDRATLVSEDKSAGTATVQVQLTEVYGSPAQTRHFAGTWQLVSSNGGWLLNSPNLYQTS